MQLVKSKTAPGDWTPESRFSLAAFWKGGGRKERADSLARLAASLNILKGLR